jgi:serine/threonine protein kinase
MELIAKKYRILKSLGQGAMGEVFLVLPPKGDPVALKLLKTLEGKTSKAANEQFENEFKVLKRLSHPNIGKIYDYGYDEELKKVFFTLPWLKGQDFYETTKDLDYLTCEDYFVQVFRALNYLHQKGIYHCDLKPGNIFIDDNQAFLIDFGLAGYWGENIVGTPTYLAPEIFRGNRHNEQSDLYAAGVIFYNCLTRSQPFSGKDLQAVYDRHRSFTPPPISEINPNVPKYISDIIATLLNKKPEERFPSAASVIEEIDAFSKNSYSVETEATLLSYLPTESEMFGNKEALMDIQSALKNFKSKHVKTPYHLILIQGHKNIGKARVIAKLKNELQLAKITVEYANPPFNEQDQNVLTSARSLILENIESYLLTQQERNHLTDFYSIIETKILSPSTDKMLIIASSTDDANFETLRNLFPLEESNITSVEMSPFTKEETKSFLEKIIGQKKIPHNFIEQFHRNTGGLPGIALDLIQSMIENGLLFDKSGRWNEDLLTDLEKCFEWLEVSESLEQDFEKTYDSLTGTEEDIINWLSICPHALHFDHLKKLSKVDDIIEILAIMSEKELIRQENENYTLYRSVFKHFIRKNLPDNEATRRHTVLALPQIGLSKKWAIYHLSLGSDEKLRLKASKKLARLYEQDGDRENSFETYHHLIKNFGEAPIQERLEWYIEASSLLIWLNRFKEADELTTVIEKEIHSTQPKLKFDRFLTLIEKKGLALLHQEKFDKAKVYFEKGLVHAKRYPEFVVHQIRFENNLGEIEFFMGHEQNAINIFIKTRELAQNLNNSEAQFITNNDLGHVYLNLKEYDQSIPVLQNDIRLFATERNREPLARALYSFAEALRYKEIFPKAIKAYEECTKICKRIHHLPLLLRTYNGLGNLYLVQENNAEALKNYQRAIDIAVRLQETTSKAALLFNQGFIYRNENNRALAIRRLYMAKQVLENKQGKLLAYEETLLSRCYRELAELAIEDQNTVKALSYQLERMKLVDDSDTLRSEKFAVKVDLAKLYLHNRLDDQFKIEIKDLEEMALNDEEMAQVNEIKKNWDTISSVPEHDSTNVLSIQDVL